MESEIENKNKNGKDSGSIPEKKSIQKTKRYTMIRNVHYSIVFRVIIQFIPCISKAMKLYVFYVFFFQE